MSTHELVTRLCVTIALTAGCGGQSERLVGPPESDAGSDGGGTGGASAGGSTSTGGASVGGTVGRDACRLYAARYTAATGTVSCNFDRASLSLFCRGPVETTTTTWDSIDAVLADNQPIGRFTFATSVNQYSDQSIDCNSTTTVARDNVGRPLSQSTTSSPEGCGGPDLEYFEWDEFGRPLAAVASLPGESPCSGQNHRFEYLDESRQVVTTQSGGTGDFCTDAVVVLTFDEDALLMRLDLTVEGIPAIAPIPYVTLETGLICR
jgi:hypothetical protein